jgi:hypothetical protein
MTSKSKNKGNALERDVRDALNTAFDCEEFARTPSSGAIMGLGNAKKNAGLEQVTKQTLGSDIICPTWFKFSIECKSYANDPNYAKIIREDDRVLNGWLGESLYDAMTLNLTPMLVFKTTRKGTNVAIPNCFKLPQSINYCLHYNGFWIMGLDAFIENVEEFNNQNNKMQELISNAIHTNDRYKYLIETMLEAKNNAKTSKKKKKKT